MVSREWWRSSVIYQVYPRSFADADGDGLGDLAGIRSRLRDLAKLGVDAVWLSPFYTSPQHDAGYDVADYCAVDPRFGTLTDFDELVSEAHRLELKVIVDLVPNHTSSDHKWFQEALASPEGSPERDRYLFRPGKGKHGNQPPNNWESVFGGSAWERVARPDGTLGEWYLHLFDKSQPDLNWRNDWVRTQFIEILKFWLDRKIDGFRVDVAHGLIKKAGLPDYFPPKKPRGMPATPFWGQPEVHEIYRTWRKLIDEYPGEKLFVAEAWVSPMKKLANWVRPDEMQQAFNFAYLGTPLKAGRLKSVINNSIAAFGQVGSPSTWVLSNHDVVRHASRFGMDVDYPQGDGIGPKSPVKPDRELGLKRARAATLLMLGLPGGSYLYQGEELGLPEDIDLPDAARQDPTWARTKHKRYGRDGCRVPLPWTPDGETFGFNNSTESWLPQPSFWADYARSIQEGDPTSTLELYRLALSTRKAKSLGEGQLRWLEGYPRTVLAFQNGAVIVIANFGKKNISLPRGEVLVASGQLTDGLPPNTTVWIRAPK
ncbi:MAG: glycoside hydrolase family 13 protein [Microbacteriaceae bacterium]|nr:glycoside hydrolase family 13 protein [Cryobacterium sp.]MBX3103448.1 glycoside hydrolase family 13 protein [Cryobacterium sp.]MCC6376095.1 glycoside hydrolase family 13 protein [Microbacteriaceae bacterium]